MQKNKNKTTEGQKMMSNLREKFGIENIDNTPLKKVKSVNVTELDSFNAKFDSFYMKTNMVKLITQLADCFKDNVVANVKFDNTGINIFALYHCKTVCINTHIGTDLFVDICCEKDIYIAMNLMVLSKKISLLQKFKVPEITFKNKDGDLSISGNRNGSPANILIKGLIYDPEELDVGEFQYDVPIRVKSCELAKLIDCMPTDFSISLKLKEKHILFTGDDDSTITELQLKLEDDVVNRLNKYKSIRGYKASFVKQNVMAIVKGSKLCDYVIVGLNQNAPLFISYTISDDNFDPKRRSQVDMYFSPKFSDDIEFE